MKPFTSLFVIAALLMAVGWSEAAVRFPPLFRENPNDRLRDAKAGEINYRLPNNTKPLSYEVELTTKVHLGEKPFTGIVKIEIEILEDTKEITLHYRQTKGFKGTIRQKVGGTQDLTLTFATNETTEFLILSTEKKDTFPKNSVWIATIAYEGELRTDNGGFYLSSYIDEKGNKKYLATTQFESTDARHAFPCYDEPARRSIFTISINHDPSYHAISNMPIASNNTGKTVFQQTQNMSTYLLAFIVSDFKSTEGIINKLPQHIYSRPGTEHDQEWALVSGLLISERLADYYNVSFPLPKLDQAAIPDFAAGAMENWGLATYREEYLLYNKNRSTINTQTSIANIIAHEYCHMWFGDLVAIQWWEYLWLKEGFATLFSYIATDDAYPEWGVWQQFHTDDFQRALSADGSNNSRPMTYYVEQPRQISSLYDSVSYSKAGSVLSMVQHALSDEVFRKGLNNYLEHNKYNSAKEDDLFNAIQLAAKEKNHPLQETVPNLMRSWTRRGGYPLLTVTRNYQNGSFTVNQRPFYDDQRKADDYKWFVPFNYYDASNWDFRNTEYSHLLKNDTVDVLVSANLKKEDWLLLNKQSTGYYRINYDKENWHLIIEGLLNKPHRIHPRNRAQLMHDAYRFMSSDILEHQILLSLLTYLKKEDQYAPWATANGIINTFNRYLSGDSDYKYFQDFVAELVNDIYEKLGINDIPGEQHYQHFTRTIVMNLACLAGIESCLQETNNKLKGLIHHGIPIEPNLQTVTYCNGLKQSDDEEFNHIYDKLMASLDQAERRLLISSLGCSQKREQIQKFISSSIDTSNKLIEQERTTLLSSAYSRGEVGLLASIDFLSENHKEYEALTPGFGGQNPLHSDIRSMSQYVVNEEQRTKMLALLEKVNPGEDVENSVNANIRNNFAWLEKNRTPILGWIRSYRNSSAGVTASFVTIMAALFVSFMRYL